MKVDCHPVAIAQVVLQWMRELLFRARTDLHRHVCNYRIAGFFFVGSKIRFFVLEIPTSIIPHEKNIELVGVASRVGPVRVVGRYTSGFYPCTWQEMDTSILLRVVYGTRAHLTASMLAYTSFSHAH